MKKIIIMSDVHLCRHDWYGVSSEERLSEMIENLNSAYDREPYEAILFLGDYYLDFWLYEEGGTFVHHKLSNTERFVKSFLSRLKCKNYYMLPGNHEQYPNEKWKEITGNYRQFSVVIGDVLFIMLDTFSGELDPNYDHDGVYTSPDIGYIQAEMAKYPNLPVVLCAHYFAVEKKSKISENFTSFSKESEKFVDFIKNEDRILCLFCGHDHICIAEEIENCGGKYLFHDGQYSYSLAEPEDSCPWGWREVWFDGQSFKTSYFSPGKKYQDEVLFQI